MKIERDSNGHITMGCIASMVASLPIKVYVNDDTEPCSVIHTRGELEAYFKGALPYCLTTKYEKI